MAMKIGIFVMSLYITSVFPGTKPPGFAFPDPMGHHTCFVLGPEFEQ